MRTLTENAGARYELVFLDVDAATQTERIARRWAERPRETFVITQAELDTWREQFEPPLSTELAGAPTLGPPAPQRTWGDWAAWRWPGFEEPHWADARVT